MSFGTITNQPKGWYQLWQYKVVVPFGSPPKTQGAYVNNGFAGWIYTTRHEAENLATIAGRIHPCDQAGLAYCGSMTLSLPGKKHSEIRGVFYSLYNQDGTRIVPGKLSLVG
jgi:hypothetical protein